MALVRTARPRTPIAEVAKSPLSALGEAQALWAHPAGGLRAAAFGAADLREGASLRSVLASLPMPGDLPETLPGPWFGAASFDGGLGPDWRGFAPLRFTLPALLAWTEGRRHFLAAFGDGASARLDEARRKLDKGAPSQEPQAISSRRLRRPDERRRWDALVARALDAIASGSLDKVVLARAVEVECGAPIDTSALLAALEARYPACRTFLVRGSDGSAFLGATPEVLCRIEGDRVFTEALAGSAQPGAAAALLGSQKDLREHRWVVDHILAALAGIASGVSRKPEPGLRTLANVVHLLTPISARLAPGRGVADVAAALHPTPAVAGVPAHAALRFLSQHEQLDRGLYAGLVGWVGPDRAELAVALRCGLIKGSHARLFVGAGIVEGSSAESEWAETELKAHALLDALGVAP